MAEGGCQLGARRDWLAWSSSLGTVEEKVMGAAACVRMRATSPTLARGYACGGRWAGVGLGWTGVGVLPLCLALLLQLPAARHPNHPPSRTCSARAATPAVWGEAMDVPLMMAEAVSEAMPAEVMEEPGATMSTHEPTLLKEDRASFCGVAARERGGRCGEAWGEGTKVGRACTAAQHAAGGSGHQGHLAAPSAP